MSDLTCLLLPLVVSVLQPDTPRTLAATVGTSGRNFELQVDWVSHNALLGPITLRHVTAVAFAALA